MLMTEDDRRWQKMTEGDKIILIKAQKFKLGVCNRAMNRIILDVKLLNRIRNTALRPQNQIVNVANKAAKLK